jgi:hypothetical protein
LAIDPGDLEANYNLMLSYNGMGDRAQAEAFQKRYMRFKADEASQVLTGPYREKHPEDNLERQLIHEHESVPLPIATFNGTTTGQFLKAATIQRFDRANVHGGGN